MKGTMGGTMGGGMRRISILHPVPLIVSLRDVLFFLYNDYGSVITTPSRSFFYLMYTGIVLFIFIPLHIYPY